MNVSSMFTASGVSVTSPLSLAHWTLCCRAGEGTASVSFGQHMMEVGLGLFHLGSPIITRFAADKQCTGVICSKQEELISDLI